ncbi:site-2 protease family protein [Bradyrhizobium septentrionale]|uniref:Site-2 protease family protein n=1 Tax=Bradyrhizobium septentrionale TaxID=1404411 RepID=A0A974A093_9BRAD|nr:site-2 protease family protein [Bradyrhizobium septentrionale]UGY13848.1 site-2 protease family protein [Bradyrhizobium septentrionale]UGY22400.1 site-2 protease family protein [Bradyrhizobium septentrionale]
MKALLVLLLSGLKWGKLAASGGSMLLSLAIYATIWGWRYAAGFIALLFAHEMGHYVAARQRGLDVGAPAFIPFMGAFIALKDHPADVETEAYVAIAGPVVGTVAALAVYLWARSEDSGRLLAIAYSGLFLNLFNLLPVSPLDGGRVTAVLSPRIWFAGVPILLALMLYRPSPMLLIVAILAAPQLLHAWRYDPHAPENIAYYGVPLQTKLEYGAAYLGLAALLAIMTYDVHEMLSRIARPA